MKKPPELSFFLRNALVSSKNIGLYATADHSCQREEKNAEKKVARIGVKDEKKRKKRKQSGNGKRDAFRDFVGCGRAAFFGQKCAKNFLPVISVGRQKVGQSC